MSKLSLWKSYTSTLSCLSRNYSIHSCCLSSYRQVQDGGNDQSFLACDSIRVPDWPNVPHAQSVNSAYWLSAARSTCTCSTRRGRNSRSQDVDMMRIMYHNFIGYRHWIYLKVGHHLFRWHTGKLNIQCSHQPWYNITPFTDVQLEDLVYACDRTQLGCET